MTAQQLIDWYRRNRERSRQLFDLIDPEAYYTRPIALRNPIVFYEGHLPAFSVIALLKRGLGHPGVDASMERLFERGIDPDSVDQAVPRSGAGTIWPTRDDVLAYGQRADEAIVDALGSAAFDLSGGEHRAMRRGEALFTALEHEAMHRKPCSTCGTGCRTIKSARPSRCATNVAAPRRTPVGRDSGRARNAWRRSRRDPLWLGQRVWRASRRR